MCCVFLLCSFNLFIAFTDSDAKPAGFVSIPFLFASSKNEKFAVSFNLPISRADIATLSAVTSMGDVVASSLS